MQRIKFCGHRYKNKDDVKFSKTLRTTAKEYSWQLSCWAFADGTICKTVPFKEYKMNQASFLLLDLSSTFLV